MDIGGGIGLPSPATEDETMARRRSRRVSFAEITAVHVFDRDEDFETPPEVIVPSPPPSLSPGKPAAAEEGEEETEGEEEEFVRPPFRFLNNDLDSSSPGSAVGSLVSNDDEDFFGPVSRSFIQSGRPSDSGMSEDGNHDITLDSETFSMHYRNIAPPDDCSVNSVGSLRTPNSATAGPLKGKAGSGSGKISCNSRDGLTDMSLIADNSDRFDYAKLSPTLNNLLEQGKNWEKNSSIVNGISSSKLDTIGSHEEPILIRSPVFASTETTQEDNAMTVDVNDKSQENCNNVSTIVHVEANKNVQPPAMLSPPHTSLTSNADVQPLPSFVPMNNAEQQHQQNHVTDSEAIPLTPKTIGQTSPILQGSISSLRSKRRQLFSPVTLATSNVVNQEACSLNSEFVQHSKRIAALKDRLKSSLSESPATHNVPAQLMFDQPSHECSFIQDLDRSGNKRSSNENGLAGQERPQKISKPPRSPCVTLSSSMIEENQSDAHVNQQSINADSNKRTKKISKPPRSPATSLKQLRLPCIALSSCMAEENQSDADVNQQSINIDWNKVASMVSNASQVFSTSVSKVKPQQLDMIEDMLGKFQRARNFKRLSSAVRMQDCGSDKQKRSAEVRSLIDKFWNEKGKQQINLMKREKLQNTVHACQNGVQECCYLKSKISDLKGATLHATTLITASDRQEGLALVTEKMHALDMIKQKMERSRSSLESFSNTKGDISCDEFTRADTQQLETRNRCRAIHQQARLWVLHDLVKRENKCDIVLNYCSLLIQRIVLNISDMSGIFVNNSLSGTKIDQKFPNLNAPVAFNFVFKAEENQKVSDLRSLQKKTTETSLLLGNLIDVLEEIKIAKIEFLNLTAAAFNMDSQTCELAFSLCFMNFKSGKRISFTIDMTDLNCAVYPSEPSELLIKVSEAQTTVAQPNLDKFMSSLRDLQPGRLMILRLCQMASQLIREMAS
uniref:Spc7 kinetochore protein domain-containing protein n=1 Tax=Leersia perrieri TaxID=77586 RepID=A0A0D9WRZ8_9ORYZ